MKIITLLRNKYFALLSLVINIGFSFFIISSGRALLNAVSSLDDYNYVMVCEPAPCDKNVKPSLNSKSQPQSQERSYGEFESYIAELVNEEAVIIRLNVIASETPGKIRVVFLQFKKKVQ